MEQEKVTDLFNQLQEIAQETYNWYYEYEDDVLNFVRLRLSSFLDVLRYGGTIQDFYVDMGNAIGVKLRVELWVKVNDKYHEFEVELCK